MKPIEIEKLYKDLGISTSNLNADYNPDLYAKKIMNQFTKIIAAQLKLREQAVENTLELLEEGY